LKFLVFWIAQIGFEIVGNKWFKGLMDRDDEGKLNMKESLGNMKDWAKGVIGFGPKIDRQTGEKIKEGPRTDQPRDEKGRFAEKGGEHDTLMNQIKARTSEFTEGFKALNKDMAELITGQDSWGAALGGLGKKLWEGVYKWSGLKWVTKMLSKAATTMASALKSVAKTLLKQAKKILAPMIGFVIAAALWVVGIISTIIGMLAGAIAFLWPVILIGLLIAGLVWIGMKLAENWARIKERFAIAMDTMQLWVAKAAFWLSSALSPIQDKIEYLFALLLDGLAGIVNGVIELINRKGSDWFGPLFTPITYRMSEGNVEAAGVRAEIRADARATEGEDLAQQERDLEERKAAFAAAGKEEPETPVVQQNNIVNNNNTRKVDTPSTTPFDFHAGAMATSQ